MSYLPPIIIGAAFGAIAVALVLYAVDFFSRRLRLVGRTCADHGRPIARTEDDGPSIEADPYVADLARSRQ